MPYDAHLILKLKANKWQVLMHFESWVISCEKMLHFWKITTVLHSYQKWNKKIPNSKTNYIKRNRMYTTYLSKTRENLCTVPKGTSRISNFLPEAGKILNLCLIITSLMPFLNKQRWLSSYLWNFHFFFPGCHWIPSMIGTAYNLFESCMDLNIVREDRGFLPCSLFQKFSSLLMGMYLWDIREVSQLLFFPFLETIFALFHDVKARICYWTIF